MRLEIEVSGRARTVTVERAASPANRFVVTVDGCGHALDVRRLDGSALSIIRLDGAAAGTSHEMAVVGTGLRGQYDVQLLEGVVRAVIDGRRAVRPAGGQGHAGRQTVLAPMPGRIVRVLVAAGDEVAERQELVVVEAMKMENAVVAPKAGRVTEVAVHEGATVRTGQTLVTVE